MSQLQDPAAPLYSELNTVAQQAVGHFMQGWGEDAAPAILNPWKHNWTENRQLDLYPDFSELILDHEFSLAAMLRGEELDEPTIEAINERCSELEAMF